MIEFCDVHLQYHYDEFELLKGATFTLPDGISTLLCDTQSGKTSVCRLILKDVEPTCGQIYVDGKELSGISSANLEILYLPSNPVFFERRSILYNIEYPLKVRKVNKNERQGIAAELAEKMGLTDLNRKVKSLSENERKRVALARGLTVPRKTVLWDDFFQGMESECVERVLELFNGNQVIVTSETRLARCYTVVLDGGITAYQGSVEGAVQVVSQLQWLNDEIRSE